jgi:hypothetical protein
MAIGASNVDTKKQVGSGDELFNVSALDAAKGFPPCQLRDWGWRADTLMFAWVASSSWFACLSLQVGLV